ncbi:MAG: hypothetical protein QOD26_729 [Betaproteobacteria bacterium]|jgi:hypothetical protein|nr:hypothetical protein [Betaproteobacteria bacterium]
MRKQPGATPAPKTQSDEEIRAKIAIAAYYLAERRGFNPGADLEDWLAAEAELKEKAWTKAS